MKFETRTHNKTEDNDKTIFIIGHCPSKQRKKDSTRKVFEGNAVGDLIQEIIKDFENIHLTNIINEYVPEITEELYIKGSEELLDEIKTLKPYKAICLGDIAKKHLTKLIKNENLEKELITIHNPGYILRFNKDKEEYKTKFKEKLIL